MKIKNEKLFKKNVKKEKLKVKVKASPWTYCRFKVIRSGLN